MENETILALKSEIQRLERHARDRDDSAEMNETVAASSRAEAVRARTVAEDLRQVLSAAGVEIDDTQDKASAAILIIPEAPRPTTF